MDVGWGGDNIDISSRHNLWLCIAPPAKVCRSASRAYDNEWTSNPAAGSLRPKLSKGSEAEAVGLKERSPLGYHSQPRRATNLPMYQFPNLPIYGCTSSPASQSTCPVGEWRGAAETAATMLILYTLCHHGVLPPANIDISVVARTNGGVLVQSFLLYPLCPSELHR